MTTAGPKKIVLLTPPCKSGMPEIAGRWMPLNLVYLAGAARQAGVVAEIYDACTLQHGYSEIERRLGSIAADYLALGAITATIDAALKTLQLAKRVNPKTVTVLGGVHPSFMYREILESTRCVDYIIIGEGEAPLRELLLVLQRGGDPATVCGLAYRLNDAIVVTPEAGTPQDLDQLPAAWDLLEWQQYSYFILPDSRFGALCTSRGCRREKGGSALSELRQQSWRGRDPHQAADEVAYLYATYQVNVFLITDEHPTCDPERWEAFLDALIARELPVHLIMESRASDVIRDREIFWKYRKAGVVHISLGIAATVGEASHAAGQKPLDKTGNDAAADPTKEALDIIHRHDIVSEASFLVGFPEETTESIKATLKLAQYHNPDNANFFPVTPWPYAGNYPELKPLIREWNYARYNLVDPILEPKQMTLRQVEEALVSCYRSFYMAKILELVTMKDTSRRRYLVRATKLIMGSAFVMKKLSGRTSKTVTKDGATADREN